MADEIRSEQPHDRLTRLCAAMTDALEAHGERGDEKCIVFLQDEERGGFQLHGYEDDTDAIVDLFVHLKALFAANGKTLEVRGTDEAAVEGRERIDYLEFVLAAIGEGIAFRGVRDPQEIARRTLAREWAA